MNEKNKVLLCLSLLAFLFLPWLGRWPMFSLVIAVLSLVLCFQHFNVVKTALDYLISHQVIRWTLLVYLLVLLSYACHPSWPGNSLAIETKVGLVVMPVLTYTLCQIIPPLIVLRYFVLGQLVLALSCLAVAGYQAYLYQSAYFYTYHALTSPSGSNAVYLSYGVALSLICLLYYKEAFFAKKWQWRVAFSLLLLFLCLLSVRMVLIATMLMILVLFRAYFSNKKRVFVGFFLMISIMSVALQKWRERTSAFRYISLQEVMIKNDLKNYPFDGLSLRLLLWRMGLAEINVNLLTQKGRGNAYHLALQDQMKKRNVYGGNKMNDTGYHSYNLHNQWVEQWAQWGFTGVFLFLMYLLSMLKMVRSQPILCGLFFFYLCCWISESALESQLGVLYWGGFVGFSIYHSKKSTPVEH